MSEPLGAVLNYPTDKLDFFETPDEVHEVTAICGEVSGLCPVTKQPDLYTLEITYDPNGRIIESKSLKLYLWKFRDQGISCEDLSAVVAKDLAQQHGKTTVHVKATQQSRGGIVLVAKSSATSK